ncbi:carbohydrate-binding protein [Formosa sp. PL04]|uniref:carbohydrate-binding protein n=1 Tax=Formosa sp. PL04 TaxID=3081755 RepID=UPI0029820833|nr:carbohydrate-binding protein [Formosa sp. PL04]MDW5289163.1 carbohydrate-binding protein [Formosa sp. PL04]
MKKLLLTLLFAFGIYAFANAQFVHPGLSHKISDLERMKYQVNAKLDPWYSTYQEMQSDSRSSYNYTVQGNTSITEYIFKNGAFDDDSRAAYYNALQWYFTGDSKHAEKSIEAMMAWTGLTKVEDRALHTSAIYIMLEAAELIKNTYPGWSTSDIDTFKAMLVYPGYSNTEVPASLSGENGTWYWRAYKFGTGGSAGNQEIAGIRACMALGIFLDNEIMYDRAFRYVSGLPHNPGPPTSTTVKDEWPYRVTYNRNFENVTNEDYHYDAALENYIWESGQCEESSRDQVHTFFGIGLLCATAEMAWNQGDDLWGHLNSRLLLGLEFTQRYNLSFRQSYPDQTTPWEPTAASGEFIQRISSSGLTKSIAINPYNDQNYDRLTRGEFLNEHMWELPIAHYVGRGFKNPDTDAKWIVRTRDYIIAETGGYESAPTGQAYLGFGGLSFRRPDGCFGDPISGYSGNLPTFAMNSLPMIIEAENFDYSPVSGEDRIYSDGTTGNSGGAYRTDENVDVEECTAGGYNIKDIESGEYLIYTVNVPSSGIYNIAINYSGINESGTLSVSFDGQDVTGAVSLPATGGEQSWTDLNIASEVSLTQGVQSMKISAGGSSNAFNLNAISIDLSEKLTQTLTFNPLPVSEVGDANLTLTATASSGLSVSFDSSDTSVASVVNGELQINGVGITTITATQDGNDLFNAVTVSQDFYVNTAGSGLIVQAEDFTSKSGLGTETTTDEGGGLNVGKTNVGDYLLYQVNVPTSGVYVVSYRVASRSDGGSLSLLVEDTEVDNLTFAATGGWQDWETVTSGTEINLTAGVNTMRLNIDAPGWNINWFKFSLKDNSLSLDDISDQSINITLYPNPVTDVLIISNGQNSNMEIFNILGKMVLKSNLKSSTESVDLSHLESGIYFVRLTQENTVLSKKLIKK